MASALVMGTMLLFIILEISMPPDELFLRILLLFIPLTSAAIVWDVWWSRVDLDEEHVNVRRYDRVKRARYDDVVLASMLAGGIRLEDRRGQTLRIPAFLAKDELMVELLVRIPDLPPEDPSVV